MELTIKQAAKKVKVSHQTLRNHIKEGKVSATKTDKGVQVIDSSELARVYPDAFNNQNIELKNSNNLNEVERDLNFKINLLEAENKALHEKVEYYKESIEKSEKREQQLYELAMQNGKLLTHYTEKETEQKGQQEKPKRKGWFFK